MDLGISGLASNFDWRSLVDQLADVERAPQRTLLAQQSRLQKRNDALAGIKTQLEALRSKLAVLRDPAFFEKRTTVSSAPSVATATAAAGAPTGSYAFNVRQLATASVLAGSADLGQPLNPTDDVSGLLLSAAGFGGGVTPGAFTVNGKRIEVASGDKLQGVFDQISAATGGAVTASYSAATDRITLAGTGAIVLGSAADTSNFLTAARLSNNGTETVTSATSLGAVRLSAPLGDSRLATPIAGVDGAGEFKINGVAITFETSDSMADVLRRINDSTAGVIASYDAANDRLMLTNRTSGDLGVALEDVTGNFLAASGLSAGALSRGKNLVYTVNGGPEVSAPGNKLTEESTGIAGLTVTALTEGAVTVTVGTDQAGVKQALLDFVTEYNKAQSLINSHLASSTDPKGKVTAGVLAGDPDAAELSGKLRGLVTATVAGLGGLVRRLDHLGFSTNGNDDLLTTGNSTVLDEALANQLRDIKDLLAGPRGGAAPGLAKALDDYLEKALGDEGPLARSQRSLTTQSSSIDTQIAEMEKWVQLRRQQMMNSFVAMETAQQKINQQMLFLQQQIK